MGYRIFYFCHEAGLMDRDLYNAFCDVGAKVKTEKINFSLTPEGHIRETYNFIDIIRKIKSFNPDFIFSIGGHGQDTQGLLSGFYALEGIPYVTWFVDDPLLIEGWGNKYCPENSLLLIFDQVYVDTLKSLAFPNVEMLPLGTNTKRWSETNDKYFPEYRDKIVFVGKLSSKQISYLVKSLNNLWPELQIEKINSAVNDYITYPEQGTEWALKKNLSLNGKALSCPSMISWKFANTLIERKASLEKRVKYVSKLLPFGLAVYGGEEWKDYIDLKNWRGQIDYYGEQIIYLYRFSKINLNISKYQLHTAVNQRVFDVPAAGGFLLTDFRPQLEEFFIIDKEVICYRDMEELKRKAIYYLEHEKDRLQVTERSKERVLKQHDYSARIRKLFLLMARLKCSELYKIFLRGIKTDKRFDAVRHKLDIELNIKS